MQLQVQLLKPWPSRHPQSILMLIVWLQRLKNAFMIQKRLMNLIVHMWQQNLKGGRSAWSFDSVAAECKENSNNVPMFQLNVQSVRQQPHVWSYGFLTTCHPNHQVSSDMIAMLSIKKVWDSYQQWKLWITASERHASEDDANSLIWGIIVPDS